MVFRGAVRDLQDVAQQRMNQLGGRPAEQARGSENGEFHTFRVTDEFTEVDTDALVEGRWVVAYELSIDPQVGYVWGFGDAGHPNQGRVYADIRDDTVDENPIAVKIQLYSDNARQKDPEAHGAWDGEELNQTKARRDSWVPLPERDMPIIDEDSRLQIRMKALEDAPGNVGSAASDLIVNATEFEQP